MCGVNRTKQSQSKGGRTLAGSGPSERETEPRAGLGFYCGGALSPGVPDQAGYG